MTHTLKELDFSMRSRKSLSSRRNACCYRPWFFDMP